MKNHPKKTIINLDPIHIQVQTTPKLMPSTPIYHSHMITPPDHNTAMAYYNTLNEAITQIILSQSQNKKPQLDDILSQISKYNKKHVSYIGVINLQIIAKLKYLSERTRNDNEIYDKLEQQVNFWQQFVMQSLVDYEQENYKYNEHYGIGNGNGNGNEDSEGEVVNPHKDQGKNSKMSGNKLKINKNKNKLKNNNDNMYDCVDD